MEEFNKKPYIYHEIIFNKFFDEYCKCNADSLVQESLIP